MSYLQQYLNEIEAEAAEKSRLARANAALIEPPLPRNAAGSPAANATETHEEALPCAA